MSAALEIHRPAELMATEQPKTIITPMDMIHMAMERGATPDVIAQAMALHERWEANQARKAFDEAMSSAKGEFPTIVKNRTVDFSSSKGRTHYKFEDLGEIAKTVDPILKKYGLSYRYRTEQSNGTVSVTCIVAHRDGHFEENTLSAGHDQSGNKNSIQAVGSTITYLQRYTLKSALGLAASHDDDGRTSTETADQIETITETQVMELRDLIEAVGADERKFLAIGKYDHLEDIRSVDFDSAIRMLKAKAAKQ